MQGVFDVIDLVDIMLYLEKLDFEKGFIYFFAEPMMIDETTSLSPTTSTKQVPQ
jgi:hypothetical protein